MKEKRRLRKGVLSFSLAVIMIIGTLTGIVPGTSIKVKAETATATGVWSDGIDYSYDTATGVLTLTGNGSTSVDSSEVVINKLSETINEPFSNISRIVISEGITSIEDFAFDAWSNYVFGFRNNLTIEIPSTVTSIGDFAFSSITNGSVSVIMNASPDNFTTFSTNAFNDSKNGEFITPYASEWKESDKCSYDSTNNRITFDNTYTGIFTLSGVTYTVTYKVINGTWDGSSKADKTESVESGASPASIPAGMKADSGYTGGSWDKNPSEATITENTTFTYTFNAKTAATVTTAPAAKTLTYNGEAQALVTAGEATGGTMQYAIGKDATTVPTEGWSGNIPTATDAKTYYVWYKAIGDSEHEDSKADVIEVTIKEKTEAHTHDIKHVEAKEPTCTEDGYEAHYECTICHEWYADDTGSVPLDKNEITKKATGHKWDDGVITQEATYDETGIKTYTCSVCGETKAETIPVKTGRSSSSSDSSDSDSESSGGGSNGKSGSISTQSLDVNGNVFGGPSAGHQPDSGMPLSDRGGNWGSMANNWSYTKSDGTLAKNEWLNLEYNGHTYWYFFDGNSTMQTDWFNYNGATYYFVPDMDGWRGRMATGWHQIGEKWYYFEPTAGAYQGVMYRGAVTPDGHIVGADGAWNGVGTTPESYAQTGTTASGN